MMMKVPAFGLLCFTVMTTALLSLSFSSSSSSSCVDAFSFLGATRAIAPTKGKSKAAGGGGDVGKLAADISKKKSPVVKVEKPDKKTKVVVVSKKKKLGVDNKNKNNNKKKKGKPVVVAKKKKEPPAKKKKIVPKFTDPALALNKKLVQQKKKGNALALNKAKKASVGLAPSVSAKLKKVKQTKVDNSKVDFSGFNLPSLPTLGGGGGGDSKAKKASSSSSSSSSSGNEKVVDYNAVINPIDFVLRVVNSEKGQEAVPILIDGGLKLVAAILDEGKQSKVEISGGYDKGTGLLKKTKVVNIGIKQLLDTALFAGSEFLPTIKSSYEKLYVGGEGANKVKITRINAKVDKKTGKVLKPVEETYFVTIGGKRQKIIKNV